MSYHVSPVARNFPRLGARSVGALGAMPQLRAAPLSLIIKGRVAALRKSGASEDQVAYFTSCMNDKLATPNATTCEADTRSLAKLTPDGMSFYKSCLSQRSADVPVRMQHGACFTEALKVPASGSSAPIAPTPGGGGVAPEAASTTPVQASMGGSTKWLVIGGVVAVAAIGFLAMRK